MNQVRLFRSQVASCRFQVIIELLTPEYSKNAEANPESGSETAILLTVAVPVVVTIVPVDVIMGGVVSIRSTIAVVSPVFPPLS